MTDRCSILVVDDDTESLALLTGLLSAEGYQVRPANSGQLALASLATGLPQLILLDIRMPGIDGFEVCRRLKAYDETRDIPLIFLSAAREVEERVHGLGLGAVDFVTKPFRREELLARVRTHLELGLLRAELEDQVAQRTSELRDALKQLQLEAAERRRAEQEARESEARFRNIADTAPMMICASGPDLQATFFNQVWLTFTGRTLEQELGTGWTANVHPEDLDHCLTAYSSSFHAREPCHVEYRMRRADGQYRAIACSGIPRFTPDGNFAGYVASCLDITDSKRAQEEAIARHKLESLGVLAGGIAHDFNNLLGSILAESELVLSDLPGNSPAHEGVQSIMTIADRASEIVRQLMAYAGHENASVEPVDISELVSQTLQLLKVTISKQAKLEVSLTEKPSYVRANASQIQQVVMNLVMNASEALGQKEGLITVATAQVRLHRDSFAKTAPDLPPGDYLELGVIDNGHGMTKEIQARIFDPFFTTKFAGRGMGLAAVQGIIRSHGGAIELASTPGIGTRFRIFLPSIGDPVQNGRRAEAPPSASEIDSITGTVLIVDDEEMLRAAVSKMLRKEGFNAIEASDGEAAVDLFRDNVEDVRVILLDVTLSGRSSQKVLEELRTIQPQVKIVLTSAYSRQTTATLIECPEVKGFLRKPYQFGELMQVLRSVLAL
jgi:PAS domain S-box-containing protein